MEKTLKKALGLLLILFSLQGVSQNGESVTGILLYHGVNPMPNVQVYLYEADGSFMDSTMTSSSGEWTFTDVDSGDYFVTFFKNGPSAGVNLTDAFMVMGHLLFGWPFEPIQELAADVNGSGAITWTDYFIILINYLNQGNPFPIGNWVFEPLEFNTATRDGFISSGTSSGDANGTFVPTKSIDVYGTDGPNSIIVDPTADFRMELGTGSEFFIEGMHLVLRVPDGLTITGIESDLEMMNIDLDNDNNEIRLTWMDDTREGYLLAQDRPLVQFTARVARESRLHNSYKLEISPESHFINLNGEIISGVELIVPVINISPEKETEYTVYPNPFTSQATLSFNGTQSGHVTLKLFDQSGRLVHETRNAGTQSGSGQIVIDGNTLVPGMYIYQLVASESNAILKTGSMIKSK